MRDRKLFSKLMATMAEIHNRDLTPVLVEVYWEVLAKYDDRDVARAFGDLIRESSFFPKPADLIAKIVSYRNDWRVGPYALADVSARAEIEDLRSLEEKIRERERQKAEAGKILEALYKKLDAPVPRMVRGDYPGPTDEEIREREIRRAVLKAQIEKLKDEGMMEH